MTSPEFTPGHAQLWPTEEDARLAVDRFIARIKAEAWDEGAEAFEAAHRWDIFEPWQHLIPNPYREEEVDE